MYVNHKGWRPQGTLGAGGFFSEAAGFGVSFFASFTVPEGPGRMLVLVFSLYIARNSDHVMNRITLQLPHRIGKDNVDNNNATEH